GQPLFAVERVDGAPAWPWRRVQESQCAFSEKAGRNVPVPESFESFDSFGEVARSPMHQSFRIRCSTGYLRSRLRPGLCQGLEDPHRTLATDNANHIQLTPGNAVAHQVHGGLRCDDLCAIELVGSLKSRWQVRGVPHCGVIEALPRAYISN